MDVIALILVAVAVVLFAVKRVDYGLAALTVAWVCQVVHVTQHLH